ncbi:MAG: hypothetical protein AB7I41_18435, partial [Candidatus Sericytochromatia bacterium]
HSRALKSLAFAPKAFTLDFDPRWLDPLRQSFYLDLSAYLNAPEQRAIFEGGRVIRQPIAKRESAYYLFSYEDYPLLWLSANSSQTLSLFLVLFEQLNLAALFADKTVPPRSLCMYGGFFVVGKQAPQPLWHYDYHLGAAAFTLIVPLFELTPQMGHLLYEDSSGQIQTYHYRPHQALIFGTGFLHSTQPYGPSDTLRVLLSLTFGSDQWSDWPLIKKNIQKQSRYYLLPCGHLAGRCLCELKYQLQKVLRR